MNILLKYNRHDILYNCSGYLHAHISYLDPGCNACLLLLSVDKDVFFKLSECKHKIQEVSLFSIVFLSLGFLLYNMLVIIFLSLRCDVLSTNTMISTTERLLIHLYVVLI